MDHDGWDTLACWRVLAVKVASGSRDLNRLVRRAVRAPFSVGRRVRDLVLRNITSKMYIASEGIRSESDNGHYAKFVERAVRNQAVFFRFKQNRVYREILEHLNEDDGRAYLAIVAEEAPDLVRQIEHFKINDRIGSPATYRYDGIGAISPTTLRYVKVVSDLRRLFGDLNGARVAEIGVGYGGQLLVLDQLFRLDAYTMFDLPPVLALASRYLESHVLNSSYRLRTLNQSSGSDAYDLVISNYAFSELPSLVQGKYAEKVLTKSRRGYLTMNSGKKDSLFTRDHLLIEQLRPMLPPFQVLEERPLTADGNFIIVWGRT
jgi:putative sugar O-methyltransferase